MAIDSLWDQERRPEQIVVVADNCKDKTPSIAEERGGTCGGSETASSGRGAVPLPPISRFRLGST